MPAAAKKVSSARKPKTIQEVQRLENAKRKLKHKQKSQAQATKSAKKGSAKQAPPTSTTKKAASAKENTKRGRTATKASNEGKTSTRKGRKRGRASQSSGTNPMIFAAAGIMVTGIIVLVILLNQDSGPKESSAPVVPVQTFNSGDDVVRRSPLKKYQSLAEAPKGITLYKDRKTGEFIDPSGLPPAYRARYTKNTKDFARISN